MSLTVELVMEDFLKGCETLYKEDILLKGCMALKKQLGLTQSNFRLTQDIDLSIKSHEAWEYYIENCCKLATANSKYGLNYEITKRRGFSRNPNSDSVGIKAMSSNGEIVSFKVDMNIKPEDLEEGVNVDYMNLYNIYGILKDKISVIVTKKVCRRVKDLIDVYTIITTMDINYQLMTDKFECKEHVVNFLCTTGNKDIIEHAYDKYDNICKPDFEEMLALVLKFILPIMYKINYNKEIYPYVKWDCEKGKWL